MSRRKPPCRQGTTRPGLSKIRISRHRGELPHKCSGLWSLKRVKAGGPGRGWSPAGGGPQDALPGPWQQELSFSALPGDASSLLGNESWAPGLGSAPRAGTTHVISEESLGVSCNHTAAHWDQTGTMGCADQGTEELWEVTGPGAGGGRVPLPGAREPQDSQHHSCLGDL